MATHIDLGVALSLNWARRDHKFGSSRVLLQNRDGFFPFEIGAYRDSSPAKSSGVLIWMSDKLQFVVDKPQCLKLGRCVDKLRFVGLSI